MQLAFSVGGNHLVSGKGGNQYGAFAIKGRENNGVISLVCTNKNGDFPMELSWHGEVLKGTAARQNGIVIFSKITPADFKWMKETPDMIVPSTNSPRPTYIAEASAELQFTPAVDSLPGGSRVMSPKIQRVREAPRNNGMGENDKELLQWLQTELNKRYGNLTLAFERIDDNKTQILTVTKLARALSEFGLSRRQAEGLFRRLTYLAHCEKRGALTLQDWLNAFSRNSSENRGEENCHPENPLLASLDTMLAATRAGSDSSRSMLAQTSVLQSTTVVGPAAVVPAAVAPVAVAPTAVVPTAAASNQHAPRLGASGMSSLLDHRESPPRVGLGASGMSSLVDHSKAQQQPAPVPRGLGASGMSSLLDHSNAQPTAVVPVATAPK